MADHPASSFALGYLAAGSSTELANDAALTIVHGRRSAQTTVDIDSLLAENQVLRNENAYLRADNALLHSNIEKLTVWGDGLYAELVKIKGR